MTYRQPVRRPGGLFATGAAVEALILTPGPLVVRTGPGVTIMTVNVIERSHTLMYASEARAGSGLATN